VTAWGVSTDGIHDETMESKILPGLYFAWEVLDIDAVTGWFNLQGCWSTGYVAWLDISKKIM
jgi:predicted flavoprotein YhiN